MAHFIVQEHHSKRLHWDFRLEVGTVLKSWAIPMGPTLDPSVKRFALQTSDHSLDYGHFAGVIPVALYGSGQVLTWDEGEYHALKPADAELGIQNGSFIFRLSGAYLKGVFALIKMHGKGPEKGWILVKKRDVFARTGWQIPVTLPSESEAIKAEAA